MWRLADRLLDTFLADGEGEFISEFAAPFTLLVIADLLGVPERTTRSSRGARPGARATAHVGSTGDDTMAHSPLEFLYERFATYIEDRRREPRDDVLTGLATATFPDGSTPEVVDVVRVAANLFSPARRPRSACSSVAPHASPSTPNSSSRCATSPSGSPTSSRRRCGSRARSRATSGCRQVPTRSAVSRSRPAPP